MIVNLLRKSIADSSTPTQQRSIRFTIPEEAPSRFALSTAARTTRTAPIIKPEKHTVPKEGPKAFLQCLEHQTNQQYQKWDFY